MWLVAGVATVGQEPQLFATPGGDPRAVFRASSNRRYRDGTGARPSDWLGIVAWRKDAEYCANYLMPGDRVFIVGTLQERSFTRGDGSKGRAYEVTITSIDLLNRARKTEVTALYDDMITNLAATFQWTPENIEAAKAVANQLINREGTRQAGTDDDHATQLPQPDPAHDLVASAAALSGAFEDPLLQ